MWDLRYYALAVTEWLGVEKSGGMVWVGIAHYNTAAELDRLLLMSHAIDAYHTLVVAAPN